MTMDSLLERIEENRLDALYLFINEALRDRRTFEIFLQNLVTVLPLNWSIQRVEVGHEFLSMVDNQDDLFEVICGLEALRTLIISDGYVPRKDNGTVQTEALLSSLPKARNLINLDLQRLQLETSDQVQMLEDVFESMSESLEDIRITGLVVDSKVESKLRGTNGQNVQERNGGDIGESCSSDEERRSSLSWSKSETTGVLDGPISQCVEMANLRSLAISQKQQKSEGGESSTLTKSGALVSQECLLDLCQSSTTLQDLALRCMNLNNPSCKTLAKGLETNSFLTSLDLRQNDGISTEGYAAILQALERNHDLWCTVMVVRMGVLDDTCCTCLSHIFLTSYRSQFCNFQDNESFQSKFNSLIELNQANRADLIRNPTRDKLASFVAQLNEQSEHQSATRSAGSVGGDPTALWYFLSIHDTILFPLVEFWQWKRRIERRREELCKRQFERIEADQSTKRPRMS